MRKICMILRVRKACAIIFNPHIFNRGCVLATVDVPKEGKMVFVLTLTKYYA